MTVPGRLLEEILAKVDSPSEAARILRRLEDHLEGFAAWERYSPNPDELAAGGVSNREFWGTRYRPMCSCEFLADRTPDGRCARCQGLPKRVDRGAGAHPEDSARDGW